MSKNTIGYYINQLPDGIREKAIANIEKQVGLGYLDFTHPRLTSVSIAVKGAFGWEDTPEGEDFWNDVCKNSPGYEAPRPMHPMMALLGAFAEMAEMLAELESDEEAPQENQEQSKKKSGTQEQSQTNSRVQEQPQTSNVGTSVNRPRPTTVTKALRQVLDELGIDISRNSVFSDARKQGVSVKVCDLYLKDDTAQKVREGMENLGFIYHRINVPSPKYAGYQGFSGTRFHFS